MLMFYHSEQSMDSHRQAYFHDRPNILSVQINVKNLSTMNTIFMQYICNIYNVQEIMDNQGIEHTLHNLLCAKNHLICQ